MDTLNILVVDDELGMRHSIRRALRNFTVHLPEIEGKTRFSVTEVETGERAVEMLSSEPFDLVLLDHKLGGMTGLDVLEQVHPQEHDMLIIMITAFATIETAVRATKSGAYDFIAKPFTPDELKYTIEKAAGHLLTQRQAKRLAEEKRRIRFDFIRVLGHELKAPLGAIESYLALMKDRTAGDEMESYDQMIARALVRVGGMRKLIVDLLDMTRIESGQKQREITDVDVQEAAQAAIDGQREIAADRGIELSLHASGACTLRGDSGEIDIVLNNLVSNAVKYNRDNGKVFVELEGGDEWLKLTVRDTGIGLTEEEAGKLFNDFVRIKNAQTRNIEGSGLGLAIVKKIAQLYRGKVGVDSEPGVGSRFTVTFNRHVEPEQTEDGAPNATNVATHA